MNVDVIEFFGVMLFFVIMLLVLKLQRRVRTDLRL